MTINYTLTDNTITVYDEDFVPFSIDSSHPNYGMVLKCLQNQEQSLSTLNYVLELMKPIESVKRKVSGTSITVTDDALYYNGEQLHGVIVDRILASKDSVDHLVKFLDKLLLNPSHRVVNQLYSFLEASGNAITKDGNFVAYKIVNSDYKDLYTRSMDNSLGSIVSVPRNKVDEDPDETCSNGLHVCGFHYLSSYGSVRSGTDRVVSVVVDPMNVVAVPRDYNNNKMRVCEYEVLADITDKVKDTIGTTVGLDHELSYSTWEDDNIDWGDDPWFNDDSEWYDYATDEDRYYVGEWVKHTTNGMPEWVDGDIVEVLWADGVISTHTANYIPGWIAGVVKSYRLVE